MHPKVADGMANSVDPEEQSDLGLHCLLKPVSENLGSLQYMYAVLSKHISTQWYWNTLGAPQLLLHIFNHL